LPDGSPFGKALKRMILRQQLLQKFHSHRITLEEFNQKLTEAGIKMQYCFESCYLHVIEKSFF